jgi:putative polyketide hydroxylase
VRFASVDGDDWCPAAEQVGHATGIGIDCHRIGPGRELVEVEGSFPERYGITSAGAVLIRPDGFVRWRAREASRDGQAGAESALTDAVAHLLGARAGASTPPA